MKDRIIFWLLKKIAIYIIKYTKHPSKCFEWGFSVNVDGVYYPVLFHSNRNVINQYEAEQQKGAICGKEKCHTVTTE